MDGLGRLLPVGGGGVFSLPRQENVVLACTCWMDHPDVALLTNVFFVVVVVGVVYFFGGPFLITPRENVYYCIYNPTVDYIHCAVYRTFQSPR